MTPFDWQEIYRHPLEALTNRRMIQKLCHEFAIRPRREAGQNFLLEAKVVQKMVEAGEITKKDLVLEIGPGLGTLTVALAEKAGFVLAIEKDPHLVKAWQKILEPYPNVKIIKNDILKISSQEIEKILGAIAKEMANVSEANLDKKNDYHYKLVASLPYLITSAVLRKFTAGDFDKPLNDLKQNGSKEDSLKKETFDTLAKDKGQRLKPELIVVMVQKEVAERVCAQPGKMSVLSVAVQFYTQPEIMRVVPSQAFWPKPKVDSAILRLTYKEDYLSFLGALQIKERRFFQIVRLGFSSRRKQLLNNLSSGLNLPKEKMVQILRNLGLNPQIRAQDLSVSDWLALTKALIIDGALASFS
jgi:16S rRNA (adenine1518-N6/adenine1519-N6)-dimethyltransferase